MYKYLTIIKKEFVLSKQVLRSGTSIGANIEETIGSLSTKDFLSKISIAYKEARETHYWLSLLKDAQYIETDKYLKLNQNCEEILRILGSIQKSIKTKIRNS